MPRRLIQSLAYRMTLAVLVVSLVLSLLAAAALFALQYRDAVGAVERELDRVGQVDVPSISAALWVMDRDQLQIHLNALLAIPSVARVTIEANGEIVAAAGAARPGRAIERGFALRYARGAETMDLGVLRVQASLDNLFSDLFSGTNVRLLFQTAQIFLVALFMLFLLRSMVTRRLSALEQHLAGLDAGRLDVPFGLPKARLFAGEDELDRVAATVGVMGANLRGAFNELEVQRERLAETLAESQRMEEALRRSERQLRLITDNVPAAIGYVEARELRYLHVNRAFAAVFGSTPEQLVGRAVEDILGAEAFARARPFIERARAGERVAYENLIPGSQGARWFAIEYVPERDEQGRVCNLVVLGQDVTVRRQAEEEIRRLNAGLEDRVRERTAELEVTNRELESFCYSVSHDLRAPLRAIEGFAGIVTEDYGRELDAEGRRLLGVVRANAIRMSRLIDDLLSFSRLGRSELQRGRLDMAAMARTAFLEVAQDPSARARIDFVVGDLPAAEGDAAMLRLVWTNLLGNAVKFSAQRERPAIEVTGVLEGGEVVYHVRDNGAGFDMQYADKLFGVFQRLHAPDEFEGTGVGLALVERVVARHGGRVWAHGAVGEGATFSFSLPAG